MRIAVVHSYYSSRQPSGENIAVDAQVTLLRDAGHEVSLVARHSDARQQDRLYPIKAGWTVATGQGPSPIKALEEFQPDLVHVHNLFPNWGSRWLTKWQGPLVATLHNFRPLCAAGTLFRDGFTCTECPEGTPWSAVRHGCYRGSRTASLPVAVSTRSGVKTNLLANARRVIVLSARARAVYQRYGFEPSRLALLPNFIRDPFATSRPRPGGGRGWLYVGRLSAEKGIAELLANWPKQHRLDVVGEGPLGELLRGSAPDCVRLVGPLPRDEVVARMPNYEGLVIPSRCMEGLPTVLLEALAAGLPVAAFSGSSAADEVANSGSGVVIDDDNAWASGLAEITERASDFATAARATYTARFRPESWLSGIEEIYSSVLPRVSP